MAVSASSGITLEYVTRAVDGDIGYQTFKFDAKEEKNKATQGTVKDPVIVFLPTGLAIVLSGKHATKLGYLKQPQILNFETVNDHTTPAGRYKFAMTNKDRADAWKEMEETVIQRCLSSRGHPLPLEARVSDVSMFAGQ